MDNLEGYYALIWPNNPSIPRAIATVESAESMFAISDSGLAWGFFQQHPDFISTWWSAARSGELSKFAPEQRKIIVQLAHGNFCVWADVLHTFLAEHRRIAKRLDETLRIFHYGHDDPKDPDGYVGKCRPHLLRGSDGWNL